MGIITKTVKIRPRGTAIAYYRERGYDAKYGQELEVKVEDLQSCSTVLIDTICDYCGKPKEPQKYVTYNAQTKNGTEKCCCLDCASLKRDEAMFKKYGYKSALQVPEIKQKVRQTNIERYGSATPSGSAMIREKQKRTSLERYGVENPSQSKEVQEKMKQTNLERYGVENVFLSDEIKEKVKKTNLDRYGVENVLLNKDIRDKRNATLIEKFGTLYPLQLKRCLDKFKQTNMKKYGVEYVSQSKEVRQRVRQTNLEKYGCENPMQSPEILEKWFSKYGSNFVKSSRQQQYLCSLYNGILNHPFRCFALDIYLPEDRLDVEFDGSGHRMSITLGNITEEDFEKKELYRNVALNKEGYKQMRIISIKDLLPSDQVLLEMLSYTRNYFSLYPNRSWIEFNIDTSTIRNAENKDGIPYQFGSLRTIKDKDINNITNNNIQNNITKEDDTNENVLR